jgi:hypothetical protein
MHLADRHCPDENLRRQNCFHLKMNGFRRGEGGRRTKMAAMLAGLERFHDCDDRYCRFG